MGAAVLRPVQGGNGLECLVARRAPHVSSPGLWEFPGGKVEPGEDPRDALARELREELSIEVEVGAFLGRGTAKKRRRQIVLDVYEATWTTGALALVDHDAVRWVGAAAVRSLDWAAADVPVLDALVERLGARTKTGRRRSGDPRRVDL